MTHIGFILGQIGKTLVSDVAPKLEGDYAGGHAAMAGLMAIMAGEAWDAAADRLVTEIQGIRRLLDRGGVDCSDVSKAPSVRLSDLEPERDALLLKLIALQFRLETDDSPGAQSLNADIWAHYITTAQARMPSPPVFDDPETG
ncbi:MAG: hypothetical protein ACON4C_04070 [Henriciella sp.]|jgi:hypothetical protein